MTWEAAGAIGEIVGALGVVATLAYLAVQIRHNTRAVSASTFQSNTELWQGWYLGVAGSDAPEAYAQGMTGRPDIDAMTFQKFYLVCRSLFLNFENQYYQYRQGALDEQAFLGYEPITRSMVIAWPGIRAWWQLNREGYGREFVAYMDGLMLDTQQIAAQRADNPGEMFAAWRALLDNDAPRNSKGSRSSMPHNQES